MGADYVAIFFAADAFITALMLRFSLYDTLCWRAYASFSYAPIIYAMLLLRCR